MSADAKMWYDDSRGWLAWRGVHDGDCGEPHEHGENLPELMAGIEQCMGCKLRWEMRQYPDGRAGLVGYTW